MRIVWQMAWAMAGMAVGLGSEAIPLWPGKAPLENGITGPETATGSGATNVSEATLTPFLVEEASPPAWLLHALDARVVPVENSVRYLLALRRHGVAAEGLFFAKGGHGPKAFETNACWESALEEWLRRRELLTGDLPK